MTDPERILDRPPNELAAALLRAGSEEAPSRRSFQRTLSALGVGAAALGAASSAGALAATKAAGSLTLVALSKWAGVGIVGGIVVAAAAHGFDAPAKSSAPAAASVVVAPVEVPQIVTLPSVVREPAAVVTPESPQPEPNLPAPRVNPARAPEEDAKAPLAAEVAFVDRGRAAFQRGELGKALGMLEGYERTFADPRLLPEVLYLRMQALRGRGDSARATELARKILRDFPRSPHASSARAILSGDSGR